MLSARVAAIGLPRTGFSGSRPQRSLPWRAGARCDFLPTVILVLGLTVAASCNRAHAGCEYGLWTWYPGDCDNPTLVGYNSAEGYLMAGWDAGYEGHGQCLAAMARVWGHPRYDDRYAAFEGEASATRAYKQEMYVFTCDPAPLTTFVVEMVMNFHCIAAGDPRDPDPMNPPWGQVLSSASAGIVINCTGEPADRSATAHVQTSAMVQTTCVVEYYVSWPPGVNLGGSTQGETYALDQHVQERHLCDFQNVNQDGTRTRQVFVEVAIDSIATASAMNDATGCGILLKAWVDPESWRFEERE